MVNLSVRGRHLFDQVMLDMRCAKSKQLDMRPTELPIMNIPPTALWHC